jgi:hypothetical protein
MDARNPPRRASRWVSALTSVALLALPACPRVASAQGMAPSGAMPLVLLVLSASGADDTSERAARTIAAHVRLLGVELDVVREPARGDERSPAVAAIVARSRALAAGRGARGVLWVGAGRGELSLYLYERDGERLFERRVPAEKGQTSAAIEALALIARSASAELLEGKIAAMTPIARSEPPAPEAAPAAPEETTVPLLPGDTSQTAVAESPPSPAEPAFLPPSLLVPAKNVWGDEAPTGRPSGGSLALGVGYLGNTAAWNGTWQSAFAVQAGWRPTPSVTLGLGYEIAPPDSVAVGPGSVQLQRHPIFLGAGYRLALAPRWDVELGGRGTVNVITRYGGTMGGSSVVWVRGSMGPTAEIGFRLLPFLRAGALVGMDVLLNPPTTTDPKMSTERVELISGLGLQLELGRTAHPPAKNTASR